MAQYERFLSYLFEYENDEKGRNCGFAKIEVRGETKRIQITVKGKTPVELLHVCGFYREGKRCICVPLGRMMINGGTGQFQYQTGGTVLRGSQIPFERLNGLVLSSPQEKGCAYATVWDDEPFGLSMFEQEEPQEQETLPVSGEQAAVGMQLETQQSEVQQSEAQRSEVQQPEAQEEAGEEQETDEVLIVAEECGSRPEKYDDRSGEYGSCPARGGNTADDHDRGTEQSPEVFWDSLCRRFQRIESLPGDSMTCLKAMPADIGRLPRPNWIFGSNGFLMYSYVRYRYIVFARVSKDDFELWVPGTYGRNEELLAEMFGFSRFRSTKSSQAVPGDFGYWCVPLLLPGQSPAVRKAEHTEEGVMNRYDTGRAAEAG